jgi:hypothetical protein
MAGPIISKLLTDFFNEIGQSRHVERASAISAMTAAVVCHRAKSSGPRLALQVLFCP